MDNPTECSVCYNKYNETECRPRTLQCGHSFCTLCVGDILEAGQVTCPTCRATQQANNVTQIPISYAVEALLKMMKVSELPQTSSSSVVAAAGEGRGSKKKQIATISPRLQPLLKEQKDITKGLMTGVEEVQSQLDQYCQQLDGWTTEHLQQIDTLSDLLEQQKATVQLLQQEKDRAMTIKQHGGVGKKKLKVPLETLQAVSTAQEFATAIDHSDHCNKDAEEWMDKCNQEYPDSKVVNTSWKVRGDTRTALEALSEHKGAEQDDYRPSWISTVQQDQTLTIMDKVNKMTQVSSTGPVLVDNNIRMVLEGGSIVYGVQQDQGDLRCSRITLDQGKVYLHCLLEQPPPPHARTMPVNEVLRFVDRSSTVTFLDLAWGGSTRGRVHIQLRPNNTRATQFMLLCTGNKKYSYINTILLKVMWKGRPVEFVEGGDYQYNTGEGGASLVTHTREHYREPRREGIVDSRYGPNSNKSAQFIINTGDYDGVCNYVLGNVKSGLEVVKAAINDNTNIQQVTVVDCGVVLSL